MGRAERRQQLKESEKRLAAGLDVRRRDGRDLVALMRVLHDRAELSIRKRTVRPLMEFIYANLGGGAKHIFETHIACARGCAHCCTVWVEASPPEVFYAVAAMDPMVRARALGAVEETCSQTAGLPYEARDSMRVPCPLLENDACSDYSGRPIACRTAVSTDADVCLRAYRLLSGEGIPVPVVWTGLRQGYSVALEGALIHAGLAHRYREWNESLRVALSDPDAEARWLGGADVFEGAPSTSAPATFNHPDWRTLYLQAFGSFP
jgi:hypothetical protein